MSTIDDFVDCICANEYAKKKLIFTNNKASKNVEIYPKKKREVRKKMSGKRITLSIRIRSN